MGPGEFPSKQDCQEHSEALQQKESGKPLKQIFNFKLDLQLKAVIFNLLHVMELFHLYYLAWFVSWLRYHGIVSILNEYFPNVDGLVIAPLCKTALKSFCTTQTDKQWS